MTQPPRDPYQPPPVMPGYPTQPPTGDWTPPPAKKRGPLPWLIGALVLLVLVVGGLIAALAGGGGNDSPAAGSTTTPPLPQDACGGGICTTTPAEDVAATTPAAIYTPKASDFKLKAKIVDKECFGSAGCNVTIEPELSYDGDQALDEDVTWRVIYEVTGVEDEPLVGNLTVTGLNYEGEREHVSTKTSKSKIVIKVTSVDER